MRHNIWIALGLVSLMALGGCGTRSVDSNTEVTEVSTNSPLMTAAAEGDQRTAERRVAEGDSVNAQGPDGTALYQAAAQGHDEIVWYLLRHGARPELGHPSGVTPMMAAAATGNSRIISMLIRAGADVNTLDQAGDNAVAYAALNSQLATTKQLINAGGEVDTVRDGQSLLMRVVSRNDILLAQLLVDSGADTRYQGADGQTALDVARSNRFNDLAMILEQSGNRR